MLRYDTDTIQDLERVEGEKFQESLEEKIQETSPENKKKPLDHQEENDPQQEESLENFGPHFPQHQHYHGNNNQEQRENRPLDNHLHHDPHGTHDQKVEEEPLSMGWYGIHVSANGENKVALELRHQFERKGLMHTLQDVIVPKRWTTALSKGMRVNVEERLIPGYVFVYMHYTPEGAHIIRSIRQVMGILGSDGKGVPKAMSQEEIDQLLSHETKEPVLQENIFFQVGETVKIIAGIFASMEGTVEDVDFHKNALRVSVPIFGRMTPVELTFSQVEKT